MNSNLAISKLILLKIVKQIPSITSNQLTNLALETLYMDYFTMVQAFGELQRDHLLLTAVRKDEPETDAAGKPLERCDISAQGEQILKTLDHKIPLHVKTYLLQATSSKRKDIRREHDIRAEYAPDANGHYIVYLSQHDGVHEIIDLKLILPDKQLASRVCRQWKNQPGSTYVKLLALLTGENNRLPLESTLLHAERSNDNTDKPDLDEPYEEQQRMF